MEAKPGASAANAWDEQKKARRLLARMDRMEEYAAKWEQVTNQENRQVESERMRRAAIYRRLVGVHPATREALREKLEEIREFGHERIEDVIAGINRAPHANRSSPVSAEPSDDAASLFA